MRKQLWVIGLAGIVGMSLLAFAKPGSTSISSDGITMAQENLTTEKCYSPTELAEAILENVAGVDIEKENKEDTSVTSDEVAQTEEEEESEPEIHVKELISNLNYDRLGIAKVDNWLNIRQKPSMDGKIIGKLPKNAGCNVYSIKDGWAKIKSGKVTGYVSSEYLVLDEEAEAYALEVGTLVATVKTTTLNARFVPSTDSSKYTLVPEGEDLEIYRENVSKKFVKSFMEKYFTGEDKQYIENVDKKAMYEQLDNWLCVRIDDEKVFVAKEFVDISYQLKKAVPVEQLSENKSAGVTSVRVSMVEYAKQFLGNRYVWGGTSLTNGTDCSGFTMSIYAHFGYSIPRTSSAQAGYTRTISSSEARPGDLFFYGKGSSVSHVAMYIGNGLVIHASNARDGIKISNAYYRTPIKVGRVIND